MVFSTLAVLYVTMVRKSSLFLSSFLRFLFLFPSSSCVGRCVFHFVFFDDDDDDDDDYDDDADDSKKVLLGTPKKEQTQNKR